MEEGGRGANTGDGSDDSDEVSGSVIRIDRTFLRDAEESVESFGALERAEAAAILGLVEFARSGAVALTGYIGLVRYLEVEGGMSRAEANSRFRLIHHCARFPLTAKALEAGHITLTYLRVLVSAASGLTDEYEADEADLLALADDRDVATFDRAVANWRNRAETAAGKADPERSFAQRGVSWQRGFDGSGHGQFSLDPLAMEILEQALDTPPDPVGGIEAPRTLRQRRADALTEAADQYLNGRTGRAPADSDSAESKGAADSAPTDANEPPSSSSGPSDLTPDSAGPTDSPGPIGPIGPTGPTGARCGTSTAVDVVVDIATLEQWAAGSVAAIRAEFAGGSPISDAVLQQLLCDARYRRLITDGPSVVLDHSSPTADITVGLRRAVQLRDKHCQFAGCDRPWNWCDVHHLIPREHQGPTNERNLTLVCRYHHTLIHQAGWHLGRDPTTNQVVTTSP